MILWVVMTVMIAVTASALTIPLVRRHDLRARISTVEVLKAQLDDVDAQVASGAMRAEDAEALRWEIKRRLLAEGRQEDGASTRPPSLARPWLALAVVSGVAIAATGLYALFGSPNLPSARPVAADNSRQPGAAANAVRDIAALIGPLEAKMRAHPGDPKGWRLLALSYMQTGRPGAAAAAYARAAALDPKSADDLSAEGEALTQAAGGQVTPAALNAFRRALSVDDHDPRARYFLAAFKDEQGDHAGAIADWIALLKDAPSDAPWTAQVRGVIARTAQQYNVDITGKLPPGQSSQNASVEAKMSARGPTPEEMAAAGRLPDTDRQAMIRGMVERLAAELKENPRNEEGWVRLMRAHMVLGDGNAAAAAYREARNAFAGQPAQAAQLEAAARDLHVPGAQGAPARSAR